MRREVWLRLYIGHFEQGKADVQQAMRLSPRDPQKGQWHNYLVMAELGLGMQRRDRRSQ